MFYYILYHQFLHHWVKHYYFVSLCLLSQAPLTSFPLWCMFQFLFSNSEVFKLLNMKLIIPCSKKEDPWIYNFLIFTISDIKISKHTIVILVNFSTWPCTFIFFAFSLIYSWVKLSNCWELSSYCEINRHKKTFFCLEIVRTYVLHIVRFLFLLF